MLKRNNIDMINFQNTSRYCYEDLSLIQNYDKAVADKENVWHCHHRVAMIMNCTRKELIAQGCYENRPAHDLIFLPEAEHKRLHMQGRFVSKTTRAKISAIHKGQQTMLGKHHTEETKARMSAAKKGKPTWNKGKHHTEETKAKMSELHKGKKLSAEHRAKLSKSFKGKHHTEETKAKMSELHKGQHLSDETKIKIAEANRKFWQRWREEHGK